ncbi:hypothetical protein IMZ11_16685 [Microtetraspora sp. AC03309]|uniref:sensor histidine kinase n=1 Tax=Microtetraspora sp. AC03309 TaxID=2779376 RepID=UPI001E61BD15|nr:histidine kinase [Microtetraspora sp. AC03309]MCC5577264.1 hypothetical protein [Microtetraspora sp. AC03309]
MDPLSRLAHVPARPPRSDYWLAAFLGVWALVEAVALPGPGPLAVRVLFALVVSAPLVLRRRFPVPVLLAIAVALVVRAYFATTFEPGATPFPALLVATFSCGLYARPAWLAWGSAPVGAGAIVAATYLDYYTGAPGPGDYALLSFFCLGSWAGGRVIRMRVAQAEEAARRKDEAAARSVAEAAATERARIARELHDVVAHSLSIIAMQAGAAERLIHTRPQAAEEHARTVRRTAREALIEMRRLLDVLHETAEYHPVPGLSDLTTLIDEARESGTGVEFVEVGERPSLAPGLELSIYRIVQEALTNTRRHGRTGQARVTIAYSDSDTTVTVSNPDPSRGSIPFRAGRGLTGMRERVGLHGGSLDILRDNAAFTVTARFPAEERPL